MRADWTCYSLVVDQLCTFTELATTMSLNDADLVRIAADILFDARNTKP